MAACKLAAKGKTLADRSYDSEVKSIQAFLSMQHPASQPVINPSTLDINVEEYVAPRFLRKIKSKVIKLSQNDHSFKSKIMNDQLIFDESESSRKLVVVGQQCCLIVR